MTDFNLVLSQVRQRLEILYQIVDELEAQGGGGGGTDDYTQLSNKPQINGHTLTGNKTGSSLGLASTSDLEAYLTSSEAAATYQTLAGMSDYLTSSDAASTYQTQAGMSSYYTKTETDAEIASEIVGAINDLDVSAVGGSTKYLTTISEANGLIDATAESPDTVPTTSSDKLITSGGVKTYVDNSATTVSNSIAGAVFGMGQNTLIPDQTGINLNDYYTPGVFIKQTASNVANFLNTPFKGSNDNYGLPVAAFKLIVEYYNSENNIRQTLIPLYESTGYFIRTRMTGAGGTWKPWVYYSGTYSFSSGLTITTSQTYPLDLDDLKTPGRYNWGTSAVQYMSSLPADFPSGGSGFIKVECIFSDNRFRQTIYANSKSNAGKFWQRNYTSEGWSSWFRFDGTEVPAPAAQLSMGNELRTVNEEPDVEEEPRDDER